MDSPTGLAVPTRRSSRPSLSERTGIIISAIARKRDDLSKARMEFGLCVSGRFQRANDLDCRRASRRRKAFCCARRGKPEYRESVAKGETAAARSDSATYWLQRLTRVIYQTFSCTPHH